MFQSSRRWAATQLQLEGAMAIFKGPKKTGILSGPERESGIFGGPKQAKSKPKRKPKKRKKKKRGGEA